MQRSDRGHVRHLGELRRLSVDDLLARRYAKFRSIGVFAEK